MRNTTAAILASVLAITPVTAIDALPTGTTTADPAATDRAQDNDDGFPWGLLGLLGLAGLLGLTGRDRAHDRDYERTTTTADRTGTTTDRRL